MDRKEKPEFEDVARLADEHKVAPVGDYQMTPGDYFERIGRAALAFSGGTDSAYLLYLALANGCDAAAYYVKTQFQPEFEQRDAEAMAEKLGVRLSVIDMDVLDSCEVAENTPSRCYFCKKEDYGSNSGAGKNGRLWDRHGRNERIGRCRRQAGHEGAGRDENHFASAGAGLDEAADQGAIKGGGAFYVEQARLCLSCDAHTLRH